MMQRGEGRWKAEGRENNSTILTSRGDDIASDAMGTQEGAELLHHVCDSSFAGSVGKPRRRHPIEGGNARRRDDLATDAGASAVDGPQVAYVAEFEQLQEGDDGVECCCNVDIEGAREVRGRRLQELMLKVADRDGRALVVQQRPADAGVCNEQIDVA